MGLLRGSNELMLVVCLAQSLAHSRPSINDTHYLSAFIYISRNCFSTHLLSFYHSFFFSLSCLSVHICACMHVCVCLGCTSFLLLCFGFLSFSYPSLILQSLFKYLLFFSLFSLPYSFPSSLPRFLPLIYTCSNSS
jgi:hypothetical protein